MPRGMLEASAWPGRYAEFCEARKWYEKGAALGSSNAMTGLGGLYENGLGVTQDYAAAFNLYGRASRRTVREL